MKGRLWWLLAVAAAWAAGLTMRLYDVQVARHDHFAERARRQQQREIVLTPPRGTIYDARGRALALSFETRSIAADPTRIDDPDGAARRIAEVTGGEVEAIARRLGQTDRRFVWIERQLPVERVPAALDLEIDGVLLPRESRRAYPLGPVAASVIGFTGVDPKGLAGLEQAYDARVAGRQIRRPVLRDARPGRVLYRSFELEQPIPGDDLHLTIDSSIQHVAERELAATIEEHGAVGGSVILLDPRDGAVLAMASYPGFDPNDFGRYPPRLRRNIPVQDIYEPGSTFKLITAAAALEAGVVDPLDRFDCGRGSVVFRGKLIRDHKSFDELGFADVIALSSNVGAIRIGERVGERRLHETIRAFGFGARTGIDLNGEEEGLVRPADRWHKRDIAYISFGQGISVTPLQLANAFAAIANGGTLYRPYVVAATGGDGQRRPLADRPHVLGRPISAATARTLERMLERVVTDGTGTNAAIPGYRVAGKTGTAEKPIGGRYAEGRYVASFVGFAPARDPRVVCLVIVDEPGGLRYHGGDAPAAAFSKIVRHALLRLGVPRDDEPEPPAAEGERVARRPIPTTTPPGVTS